MPQTTTATTISGRWPRRQMEETRYKLAKAEVKLQLESLSPEERAEAASQEPWISTDTPSRKQRNQEMNSKYR